MIKNINESIKENEVIKENEEIEEEKKIVYKEENLDTNDDNKSENNIKEEKIEENNKEDKKEKKEEGKKKNLKKQITIDREKTIKRDELTSEFGTSILIARNSFLRKFVISIYATIFLTSIFLFAILIITGMLSANKLNKDQYLKNFFIIILIWIIWILITSIINIILYFSKSVKNIKYVSIYKNAIVGMLTKEIARKSDVIKFSNIRYIKYKKSLITKKHIFTIFEYLGDINNKEELRETQILNINKQKFKFKNLPYEVSSKYKVTKLSQLSCIKDPSSILTILYNLKMEEN